jgi:DNA-binding CsgD family transcriptional regulator
MELLERETFLDSLTSYADEALLGQGRVVLVAGEAGVGKTALLDAFQERIPGATWAWGACDGLSTPRPLAPLHDVARELGGALLCAVQDGATREALFDALVSRLASGSDLTVVVIEDMHWADEATLDLVRHVARRLTSARALLLLTYRDDGLAADDMLRTALGDLSSYRGTRRMALPALSEQAVARLAAGSPIEAAVLHRLTAGNPYFLSEVLAGHGEEVPPSARDAVLARAARLEPPSRAALDVAAVVGARLDPAVLRAVPGVTGEALDACVASGLLVELGSTLAFRHDLARLAVAAAVPPQRRAELHGAVLAALRRAGSEDHALLAHHADEGGDADAVLRHAPAAAWAAADVASHREAAAQYARALRYADGLAPRERAELYERLADQTALIDHWEQTAQAREQALAIWRELGDDLRTGNALRLLVAPYWRLCRGADCARASQEAVALLEPLGPSPELTRAWLTSSGMLFGEGKYVECAEVAGQAAEHAREQGLLDCLSDALNNLSCVQLAHDEDPTDLIRASIAAAVEGGHEAQVGRGYANAYESLTRLWRLEEADALFIEASAYIENHDMATYGTCLRGQRTWSLRQQGRTLEASDITASLVGAGLPSPVNSLNPLSSAGVLAARTGDRQGTWPPLDEALTYALDLGEAAYVLWVRIVRVEAFWLEGEQGRAASELALLLEALERPDSREAGECLVWARRLDVDSTRFRLATWPAAGEPWATELAGEHRRAAEGWTRRGAHYLAALALAFSDDEQDLRHALDRFTAMETPAAAARVRQLLRERGASVVPAGPRATTRAHPAGLTRRESEVLEGLARGLTNAELAAELFLSERTVEHHVSNVLAKLQVGTRAEAASEAERRGLLDAVAT